MLICSSVNAADIFNASFENSYCKLIEPLYVYQTYLVLTEKKNQRASNIQTSETTIKLNWYRYRLAG